jgi:hypothetical protein
VTCFREHVRAPSPLGNRKRTGWPKLGVSQALRGLHFLIPGGRSLELGVTPVPVPTSVHCHLAQGCGILSLTPHPRLPSSHHHHCPISILAPLTFPDTVLKSPWPSPCPSQGLCAPLLPGPFSPGTLRTHPALMLPEPASLCPRGAPGRPISPRQWEPFCLPSLVEPHPGVGAFSQLALAECPQWWLACFSHNRQHGLGYKDQGSHGPGLHQRGHVLKKLHWWTGRTWEAEAGAQRLGPAWAAQRDPQRKDSSYCSE